MCLSICRESVENGGKPHYSSLCCGHRFICAKYPVRCPGHPKVLLCKILRSSAEPLARHDRHYGIRISNRPVIRATVPYLLHLRILQLKVGSYTSVPTDQSPTQTKDSAVPVLETFVIEYKYDMLVIGEEKGAEISALLHNAPRLHSFSWNDDDYRLVPPCILDIPRSLLILQTRMLSRVRILGIFNQPLLL